MKVLLDQSIKDYQGNDIEIEGVKQTYQMIIGFAVTGVVRDEILTAEKKMKAHQLANKIYGNKEVDLTADDIVFIKERVDKVWQSPLYYGRILELLEEKVEEIKENIS